MTWHHVSVSDVMFSNICKMDCKRRNCDLSVLHFIVPSVLSKTVEKETLFVEPSVIQLAVEVAVFCDN